VADETPGFGVSDDGNKVVLTYSLENNTPFDYRATSSDELKLLRRFARDDALSQPVTAEAPSIGFPIFIPARQKAEVSVTINFVETPKQKPSETAEQFHETLRAYVLDQMRGDAVVVLFDEANRYEINLPKPAAQPPAKKSINRKSAPDRGAIDGVTSHNQQDRTE
jgi:hypothetical protein